MRAAAYARYSTDNQTDNSIAYQLNAIQQYCTQNKIDIVAVYTDEAFSGTNLNRKGFLNMMNGAKNGDFDAVIIYDMYRGSRDIVDWFNFRKELEALKIQLISCTQQIANLDKPNEFFMEAINIAMGHYQVLDTRQKSIAGVAEKAKQGIFLGGVPPLGYCIKDGKYVIEPTEAAIVKKIFEMYADGKSYEEIIESVGSFKGRYGRPFGKNSLYSILRNERYIGVYTWNKRKVKHLRKWAGGALNPDVIRIEGAIPAIIDDNTWRRVEMRTHDTNSRARNKAKREYLLSGLIYCASCGAAYVGDSCTKQKNGNTYSYHYYACGNRKRTRTCKSNKIRTDELDAFVIAQLTDFLKTADFKQIAENITNEFNSEKHNVNLEIKELLEIDRKIKNCVNAISGGLDIPELHDEIVELRKRKEELSDLIALSKQDITPVTADALAERMELATTCLTEITDLKPVIKRFITGVYVNPDGTAIVQIGFNLAENLGITADVLAQKNIRESSTEIFTHTISSGEGI